MRGFLLTSAAIFLAAGIGSCATPAAPNPAASAGPVAIEVSAVAVDLRPGQPEEREIGRLVYRGGVALGSADERFGGLSAFRVSADGTRFAAVTDVGDWVRGELAYGAGGELTGVRGVTLGDLRAADGRALAGKSEGDSEGLAFADAANLEGDAFVSFEADHRILRFPGGLTANGVPVPMPAELKGLQENSGLEVLAELSGGALLAISETGAAGEDADSVGWLVDPAKGAVARFTVKRNLPYALTGATELPGGDVLLVERRFAPATGPGMELRRIPRSAFVDGAVVDGEVVATLFGGPTVDNMEGVSARRGPNGETLVYVVSDDNFNAPLQRTLLMMFELR